MNDKIAVMIPSVGEILDCEDAYYGRISLLTATPYDLMVELDDAGVDFETIDDYDLFLRTYHAIGDGDASLLFGELDLSRFKMRVNPENGIGSSNKLRC